MQFSRRFFGSGKSSISPVNKIKLSPDASNESKEGGKKQTRRFDAHTYSIWAKEMAKRGKPDEAISLLENVIVKKKGNPRMVVEEGKVIRDPRPSNVIFNTAIDVCGHAGKFNKAWTIFNDMKKRGVRPVERTVASMLNALAESIDNRPESQMDSTKIWAKALQLYSQEIAGSSGPSAFLLNGILKVASRLEEIERMRTVFPVDKVPGEADEISFTLVLNLLARCGKMEEAAAYFQALEAKFGGSLSWRPVAAMLTLIRRDVMNPAMKLKMAFKDWRDAQASLALDYLAKVPKTDEPVVPIAISTLILEILTKLHAWQQASTFISTSVLPVVNEVESLKEIRADIDSYVLSLTLKCLANGADPAEACKQTFQFFEKLIGKGFHPSTNDINGLLMVCNRAKLEGRADAFYRAHFRKKHAVLVPDTHSCFHLMAALHSNADPAYTETIKDHWKWLKEAHPRIFAECKDSARFARFKEKDF